MNLFDSRHVANPAFYFQYKHQLSFYNPYFSSRHLIKTYQFAGAFSYMLFNL